MFVVLSVAMAFADDLVPEMDDHGTVVVRTVVPDSQAAVLAALRDPEAAALLPPEVLGVTTLNRGECVTLGVTVKGAWDPLKYTTQRCPTKNGYKYKLLQSDTLTAYEAEWSLASARTGGTEVTYRVRTELNMPVPKLLVRKGMLQSARDTLIALVRKVTQAR